MLQFNKELFLSLKMILYRVVSLIQPFFPANFHQIFFWAGVFFASFSFLSPFSPSCPPSYITCHFPSVPVCCVSVTSWKIYYSYLFLLPLPVSPSVSLSIIVTHTGLYNYSFICLWTVCFSDLCSIISVRLTMPDSPYSFLSFEPFHLSTAICRGSTV